MPAHASMFTGVPSSVHGVTGDQRLGKGHPTLARVLTRHGYRARGLWSGPYLHPVFRLDRGFAEGDYEGVIETSYDEFDPALGANGFSQRRDEANKESHVGATSPRVVSRAIEFLEDPGPKPFFLFLHFFDIHYDYTPPEDIWRRFDALDRLGLRENTLILATSDHGDEFFEHARKGHRKSLFDEVIAVPLVVAGAGVTVADASLPDLVHHMDLMPTILDMLGIPCPQTVMGRSFAPLLRGQGMERGRLVPSLLVQTEDSRVACVRAEEWKAVWEIGPDGIERQFFDLVRDPGELEPIDVGADDPRREQALQALGRFALLKDAGGGSGEGAQADLPGALEQQLRELGYLK